MVLAQGPGRLDGRVRDLLVVLEGLEGRLREELRVLPPEQRRLVRLVVGVLGARDQGQDRRDREGDGGGRLVAAQDVELGLEAADWLVDGCVIRRGEDWKEWMYEDVVRLESCATCQLSSSAHPPEAGGAGGACGRSQGRVALVGPHGRDTMGWRLRPRNLQGEPGLSYRTRAV